MVKSVHSTYVTIVLSCEYLLHRIVSDEKINITIMMIIPLPHPLRTSLNVRDQHSRQYSNSGWIIAVVVCMAIIHSGTGWCSDDVDLWKEFRSGSSFVLLRHAIAPGTGDPDHFVLGNCLTQRNLSDAGRGQATTIGMQFRANKIQKARIISSQWCRCLETAELLKLGPVEELPLLNSFFQYYERGDSQTDGLRRWIGRQNLKQPLVLVTHQVNITSLTHYYPASGELVFARRLDSGEIAFIGSITTD